MSIDLAKKILGFEINTNTEVQDMYFSQKLDFLESYAIIEQARNDFLKELLTWEEYLELLELHKINVDEYLEIVDDNLKAVGA
jgi:hypothetical protein